MRSIVPGIARGRPRVRESPEALSDLRKSGLIRQPTREPLCCRTADYATAGDKTAHERNRRGDFERRAGLTSGGESEQNAAAITVIHGDDARAILKGLPVRWRLEQPPVGTDIERIDMREHAGHGVGASCTRCAGKDLEQQLTSLRATERGNVPQVALLRFTQLA